MSQPDRDEAREIASPVKFFDPAGGRDYADLDLAPKAVRADDVLPQEAVDVAPKVRNPADDSSAQGSAESYSDLIPSPEDAALRPENSVGVEKEPTSQLPLENDEPPSPASSKQTSDGETTPPVVTPPSPPAKTPSSRSAGK